MMLVADEAAKQKEKERQDQIKQQLAQKALEKKKAEEEQRKRDIKKTAEEKIRIAEEVKIKAIAEAEQAKKEYFKLVTPPKKEAVKVSGKNQTKSLAQKSSKNLKS